MKGGQSIDTTMGFTPLEGLVMATRSGTVDPGLVLWLVREAGLSPARVNDALEHESGALALAGTAKLESGALTTQSPLCRSAGARTLAGSGAHECVADLFAQNLADH